MYQAKLRYQDAHQRATNLQFNLKENIQDMKMHKKRMERMKLANEKLVGPQTDRLRKEIAKLEVFEDSRVWYTGVYGSIGGLLTVSVFDVVMHGVQRHTIYA